VLRRKKNIKKCLCVNTRAKTYFSSFKNLPRESFWWCFGTLFMVFSLFLH